MQISPYFLAHLFLLCLPGTTRQLSLPAEIVSPKGILPLEFQVGSDVTLQCRLTRSISDRYDVTKMTLRLNDSPQLDVTSVGNDTIQATLLNVTERPHERIICSEAQTLAVQSLCVGYAPSEDFDLQCSLHPEDRLQCCVLSAQDQHTLCNVRWTVDYTQNRLLGPGPWQRVPGGGRLNDSLCADLPLVDIATSRNITVRARASNQIGTAEREFTFLPLEYGVSGPVQRLKAEDIQAHSLALTWHHHEAVHPMLCQRMALSYRVHVTSLYDVTPRRDEFVAANCSDEVFYRGTEHRVSGLLPYTVYSVTVTPLGLHFAGPPCHMTARTDQSRPLKAPRILGWAYHSSSPDAIALYWKPFSHQEMGGPITAYTVSVTAVNSKTTAYTFTINATEAMISGRNNSSSSSSSSSSHSSSSGGNGGSNNSNTSISSSSSNNKNNGFRNSRSSSSSRRSSSSSRTNNNGGSNSNSNRNTTTNNNNNNVIISRSSSYVGQLMGSPRVLRGCLGGCDVTLTASTVVGPSPAATSSITLPAEDQAVPVVYTQEQEDGSRKVVWEGPVGVTSVVWCYGPRFTENKFLVKCQIPLREKAVPQKDARSLTIAKSELAGDAEMAGDMCERCQWHFAVRLASPAHQPAPAAEAGQGPRGGYDGGDAAAAAAAAVAYASRLVWNRPVSDGGGGTYDLSVPVGVALSCAVAFPLCVLLMAWCVRRGRKTSKKFSPPDFSGVIKMQQRSPPLHRKVLQNPLYVPIRTENPPEKLSSFDHYSPTSAADSAFHSEASKSSHSSQQATLQTALVHYSCLAHSLDHESIFAVERKFETSSLASHGTSPAKLSSLNESSQNKAQAKLAPIHYSSFTHSLDDESVISADRTLGMSLLVSNHASLTELKSSKLLVESSASSPEVGDDEGLGDDDQIVSVPLLQHKPPSSSRSISEEVTARANEYEMECCYTGMERSCNTPELKSLVREDSDDVGQTFPANKYYKRSSITLGYSRVDIASSSEDSDDCELRSQAGENANHISSALGCRQRVGKRSHKNIELKSDASEDSRVSGLQFQLSKDVEKIGFASECCVDATRCREDHELRSPVREVSNVRKLQSQSGANHNDVAPGYCHVDLNRNCYVDMKRSCYDPELMSLARVGRNVSDLQSQISGDTDHTGFSPGYCHVPMKISREHPELVSKANHEINVRELKSPFGGDAEHIDITPEYCRVGIPRSCCEFHEDGNVRKSQSQSGEDLELTGVALHNAVVTPIQVGVKNNVQNEPMTQTGVKNNDKLTHTGVINYEHMTETGVKNYEPMTQTGLSPSVMRNGYTRWPGVTA